GSLDDAIGQVLVDAVTPLALEVALTVQQELAARAEEADRLRQQQVERARYDADVAQRRFLRVDPENRLVADALEAAWNDRLRALAAAQETYAHTRAADARVVSEEQRAEILALATDFPRLWRDPATSAREKKRMMRLLIADVTLTKGKTLHADIRFTGGATRSLDIPLPKSCIELRTTDVAIVREIDDLLDTYTDAEIADLLNERGVRTATMRPFTRVGVIHLRVRYGLKNRRTRMLEAGLLTPSDVAARYGVQLCTVHADASADPEIERATSKRRIPFRDDAIATPLERHRLWPIDHRDQGNAAEREMIDHGSHKGLDTLIGHQRDLDPSRVLQSRREEV